jgi:hypothetical protein
VNVGTQTNLFEMFEAAKRRMEERFNLGPAQEQFLLDIVTKTVIRDRLVPPTEMSFGEFGGGRIFIRYRDSPDTLSIHRHALNQLCQKVQLTMTYMNRLLNDRNPGMLDLACYNLEALFNLTPWPETHGPPRFLHRIVGTELRGFLSRRYNRHLASAPLLRSFIDQCKVEGAKPVEATSSPIKHALKCFIPKVFEAYPGEYICVGVEWSNSDFGSGRLNVLQTVWRVVNGAAVVVDQGLRRAHIGSIIEDSDVDMSDDTAKKEVEAQQSAVRDHVKEYLAENSIDRMLEAIARAHEEKIPWGKLSASLSDVLSKGDLKWMKEVLEGKAETIIDLPPISYESDGTRVPNLYWAASTVSAIATKTEDEDQRLVLQREAGKLLAAAMVT